MLKFETLLNIASSVGADLSHSNKRSLTGDANFDRGNLSNADLGDVVCLGNVIFQETIMPDGSIASDQ